jgi:hypothetical protein
MSRVLVGVQDGASLEKEIEEGTLQGLEKRVPKGE